MGLVSFLKFAVIRHSSHLFHRGIVKKDPLRGLGVEGKGTIVAAGVADHPDKLKFTFLGMLIGHPVEELRPHTHT